VIVNAADPNDSGLWLDIRRAPRAELHVLETPVWPSLPAISTKISGLELLSHLE